jgi:hypothetical protein
MSNLEELSLSELRLQYPDLKATSKKVMLEKIDVLSTLDLPSEPTEELEELEIELVDEVTSIESKSSDFKDSDEQLTFYNIMNYIRSVSKQKKKIIIKTSTTMSADFIWKAVKEELYPEFEKEGLTIMGSSSRRDNHINGSCYLRFVCQSNYNHLKTIFKYDTFKELV